MGNEIINTGDLTEADWDGSSEPGDVPSDIVATHEAEGRGIEFHVSMRDYTKTDMEDLIVAAAAQMIVGRRNEREMAKAIETKCIELVDQKATAALEKVTAEIIDQPLTPSFGDKKPVTMREFLGLYSREYLTQIVDRDGKPKTSAGWGGSENAPRIERIIAKIMDGKFKAEIEKASNGVINEIRLKLKARHDAVLAAETERLREYLAKSA